MPAFRIPRARVEVEVAHLEREGYRVEHVKDDGGDFVVFCRPLWKDAARPLNLTPQPVIETRGGAG